MFEGTFRNLTLAFLLFVSFFGFLLVGVLGFKSPASQESFPWQKQIVGIVYGIICISGILAALFPKSCLQILNPRRKKMVPNDLEQSKAISRAVNVQGHHHMCGHFSSHVFNIRSKTFCASCTGLLTGGLLAFVGTVLHFFCNWHIGGSLFLFVIGVSGVALNMLSILLFDVWIRHLVRVCLNFFFVFGTFLILVAVNEQTQSFGLNLLVTSFSVFWLLTRILLSQWRHERICNTCGVKNCGVRQVRAGYLLRRIP